MKSFPRNPCLRCPWFTAAAVTVQKPVLTSFRSRSRYFVIGFQRLHQSLTHCQPDDINPNHCLHAWETERTWNYLGTVQWRKQLYLIWLNVETERSSPSLSWKLTGLKQVVGFHSAKKLILVLSTVLKLHFCQMRLQIAYCLLLIYTRCKSDPLRLRCIGSLSGAVQLFKLVVFWVRYGAELLEWQDQRGPAVNKNSHQTARYHMI